MVFFKVSISSGFSLLFLFPILAQCYSFSGTSILGTLRPGTEILSRWARGVEASSQQHTGTQHNFTQWAKFAADSRYTRQQWVSKDSHSVKPLTSRSKRSRTQNWQFHSNANLLIDVQYTHVNQCVSQDTRTH